MTTAISGGASVADGLRFASADNALRCMRYVATLHSEQRLERAPTIFALFSTPAYVNNVGDFERPDPGARVSAAFQGWDAQLV